MFDRMVIFSRSPAELPKCFGQQPAPGYQGGDQTTLAVTFRFHGSPNGPRSTWRFTWHRHIYALDRKPC
jgi:hypothetical protein